MRSSLRRTLPAIALCAAAIPARAIVPPRAVARVWPITASWALPALALPPALAVAPALRPLPIPAPEPVRLPAAPRIAPHPYPVEPGAPAGKWTPAPVAPDDGLLFDGGRPRPRALLRDL